MFLGRLELTLVPRHWAVHVSAAHRYGLRVRQVTTGLLSYVPRQSRMLTPKATASVAAYRLESHGRTCLCQPELCASPSIYADDSSLHYILSALPFHSDAHSNIRTVSLVVLYQSTLRSDISTSAAPLNTFSAARQTEPYMHHNNPTVSPHLTTSGQLPQQYLRRRVSDHQPNKPARNRKMMGKNEMPVSNFSERHATRSRCRFVVSTILLILCIPVFFYHLAPTFTHATDDIMTSLTTRLRGQSSQCTSEVGSAYCCTLFLDAAPCVDECRKIHVDRVTWMLTEEYDECSDTCLATYHGSCERAEG
jgi:hypothetical protein